LPHASSGVNETQAASHDKEAPILMSVARVTEISAVSEEGFEDAIRQGIDRATRTLRNVEGAWVKDQNVMIEDGDIKGYKVNLEVTFVLEDDS
jgi:dodecin